MAEETTYKVKKFGQTVEIPAPDTLIMGWSTSNPITLAASGEVKRGTLLMSGGENEFTPATAAGISNAFELAILCEDIEAEEDEPVEVSAYFGGAIDMWSLILPYETEEDNHGELIEAIRPAMRRSGFILV